MPFRLRFLWLVEMKMIGAQGVRVVLRGGDLCPTRFQAAFVENERVGSKCPSDGDLCKILIFGPFLRNALL